MHTLLRIEGANCPVCFNETIDDLARIDGVREVRGSIAGPCIEIDHDDVAVETFTLVIGNRMHGVEMFAGEFEMTSVEPVPIAHCEHHHTGS